MDLRLDSPLGRTQRAVQAPPCAMVIFGSSGDLTKRLLIPALYNLAKAGRLSDKFALIGVDRTDRSHEEFRAYLAEGVRSFVSDTGTGPVTSPATRRSGTRSRRWPGCTRAPNGSSTCSTCGSTPSAS